MRHNQHMRRPGQQRPASSHSFIQGLAREPHQRMQPNQQSPPEGPEPIRRARQFSGARPSHRPWISAKARPCADRFHTTTRRNHPTPSVTFLRDTTTPRSVTFLFDLTGNVSYPAAGSKPASILCPGLSTEKLREAGR